MSERMRIVTIDGPSGVGKSTVSKRLADRLSFTYLDTGAMYRAVAWGCMQAGIDPDDREAVARFLGGMTMDLRPPEREGEDVQVLLNGEEIGSRIRTPEMGMAASRISAIPVVREKLTALQQDMGRAGGIVAEGRDTGTVVFPEAAWKFYLDAAPGERARRRVEQLRLKGENVDEKEILEQIIQRDRDDKNRTIAPLVRAEDAVLIDSSSLSVDEVVARMLAVITAE